MIRRVSLLLGLSLSLICLADWLFFRQPAGCTLALFFFAITLAVAFKGGAYLLTRTAVAAGIALAGLLFALILQPGPIVVLVTLIATAAFALFVREGLPVDAYALLLRLLEFAVKSPAQAILDIRPLRRFITHPSPGTFSGAFRNWTLPLAGSALFLGLFTIANPVLSHELDVWSSAFQTFLTKIHVPFDRFLIWIFTGTGTWALLRVRTRVARNVATAATIPMSDVRTSLVVRCLALFNLVFAVQTLLDITYLFGGMRLPEGMTYAEYAHRGSYPLVATALLAAVFVLIAYRPGAATRETTTARRLVLLWLAQNIFLTSSAAWRLHLYTNVYSLTRLRVAAGIWMLLVAVGLAWIGLRILSGRSNRWLISRNLATTAIVLYLCCFVNFEGMIAWHNVQHCREIRGSGTALDYAYMYHLGPEAIPALQWLRSRGLYRPPSGIIEMQQAELDGMMGNWRAWTYRRIVLWNGSLPPAGR